MPSSQAHRGPLFGPMQGGLLITNPSNSLLAPRVQPSLTRVNTGYVCVLGERLPHAVFLSVLPCAVPVLRKRNPSGGSGVIGMPAQYLPWAFIKFTHPRARNRSVELVVRLDLFS